MDWVEFYNASSEDIDITGWYLSDNLKKGKETKAQILGSCIVPAGGYEIVWLDMFPFFQPLCCYYNPLTFNLHVVFLRDNPIFLTCSSWPVFRPLTFFPFNK